jgi:RNA polymerase sigma-70 factor, ECF subfamily
MPEPSAVDFVATVPRRLRQQPPPIPPMTVGATANVDGDDIAAALREYRTALQRSARMLCGNRADADDLVHDVYERALRGPAPRHGNLRAWLHSMLRNLFIDRCRHARRHPCPISLDHVASSELATTPSEHPRRWHQISSAQLSIALAMLPAEFRIVFELHVFEGLRYDQIAVHMGIAASTVGTRLNRARAKLRAILLGQLGGDPVAARSDGRSVA